SEWRSPLRSSWRCSDGGVRSSSPACAPRERRCRAPLRPLRTSPASTSCLLPTLSSGADPPSAPRRWSSRSSPRASPLVPPPGARRSSRCPPHALEVVPVIRACRFKPSVGLALAPALLLLSLVVAPAVAAHEAVKAGPYDIEMGWLVEPTYVGQPNAVSIT